MVLVGLVIVSMLPKSAYVIFLNVRVRIQHQYFIGILFWKHTARSSKFHHNA